MGSTSNNNNAGGDVLRWTCVRDQCKIGWDAYEKDKDYTGYYVFA